MADLRIDIGDFDFKQFLDGSSDLDFIRIERDPKKILIMRTDARAFLCLEHLLDDVSR